MNARGYGLAVFLASVFAFSSAWGRSQHPTAKPPLETALTGAPRAQRFVGIGSDGSVALDTQAGRLCKTWDWHYKSDPEYPFGKGMETLRTCTEMLRDDSDWVQHMVKGR